MLFLTSFEKDFHDILVNRCPKSSESKELFITYIKKNDIGEENCAQQKNDDELKLVNRDSMKPLEEIE